MLLLATALLAVHGLRLEVTSAINNVISSKLEQQRPMTNLNIAQRIMKQLHKGAAAGAVSLSLLTAQCPANAASIESGEQLFKQSCVGCHEGGGNIIPFSGSKTLKLQALLDNGFATEDDIVKIINNGKGSMMAFGSFKSSKGNIIPARFTEEQMHDIASYVLKQANDGWQSAL